MAAKSKILLIIDQPDLSDSISHVLQRQPYDLLESSENVMQTVFDEVPHLIVLDADFRNGGGKSIARQLKQDVVLKHIPIILLVESRELELYGKDELIDYYFERRRLEKDLVLTVHEALAKNFDELDLNPLTHLPGSRSSVLKMERAIRANKLFAVCSVDLSDLTAYNSAYGDARGDKVIVKLAQIIQEALKKEGAHDDFLGHLGGDDFVIVTHANRAVKLSESIIHQFDAVVPNYYDAHDRAAGHIFQRNSEGALTRYSLMKVSVVIVHNDEKPLIEISQIGRIAGELKKHMKTLPGSCYLKYRQGDEPSGEEGAAQDTHLEIQFPGTMQSVKVNHPAKGSHEKQTFLTTVLKGKRIKTLYQPILELRTKKIVGYEALTRGTMDHFLDAPTLLFDIARESSRVRELDELCVEYALESGQELEEGQKLFINLNHETLIDAKVMKKLFLKKGTIGFKNIVIEVTEQSILRSFQKVREALLELKEQGVSVAIDDVGGGAVSLRDVAILKPDYIKFDRSLIRQINGSITKQQIVLSMILFANGIQAITTAEGIETKKEYETVMMLGIQLGQGYYFARPGKAFPEILV